ncbi:MAG: hypothetical protein Q4F85_10440 [Prevotella sp.]|nr:hypothetical protein [Prevotella sp.]
MYPCIVVKVMTTVAEPFLIGCMNRHAPFGEPPRAAVRTVSRRSANRQRCFGEAKKTVPAAGI